MDKKDFLKALAVTAEIFGKTFSEDAANMYLSDLDGHPVSALISALSRCRKELRFFPTVSEILSRIDDGRPGVDEAWALCPKSEAESVVWTSEIKDAFFVCATLLPEDPIAARMAFKEKYTALLSASRANKIKVSWEVSLGHDPQHRVRVLTDAVAKNILPASSVRKLLPPADLPEQTKKLLSTIHKTKEIPQ